MSKLILAPLAAVAIPQAMLLGFFAVVRWLQGTPFGNEAFGLCVVLSFLAMVGGAVAAAFMVFDGDGLLAEYRAAQRALRMRREKEMAALDDQIGIPRIGRP